MLGDYMLDPPDDPPLVTCPECEGNCEDPKCPGEPCPRCKGDGEDYLTDEEVRDARAEAAIERAEARRDGDL